ncbi:CRISPR-associated ring nuclease Csm6 [Luteithermobacter gelatinilyticus]|uniref:CRISPR-associated ring nuclease Csm6 n=1 Tax=Luteithermobacter gelatinilyticus TaxID=2582913 RepID=UPI0011074B22|nr:CRISPR-associated ring nuclease Csm6 [Luteithermobacter gelatinilyticus]
MTRPAVTVLALCGLTPQVITETLWALLRDGITIGRLHIVTTSRGKELFDAKLAGPDGALTRLWRDLNHDAPLPPHEFHLIRQQGNTPIEDMVSGDDHLAATELIGQLVHRMTRPECPPLHASAAGGRKTMSIMLSLAMSLYARPEDRLSHVLVSPDYERDPDFLYPPPGDQPPGSFLELIDVPFPRLTPLLKDIAVPPSMAELIDSLDRRLESLDIVHLDLTQRQLLIRDQSVCLPPILLAVYLLFVRHRQKDESGIEPRYLDIDLMATCYRDAGAAPNDVANLVKRLSGDNVHAWFLEQISRLRRLMTDQLGPILAQEAGIESLGKRPRTRYRLRLPAWRVLITPDVPT